MRWQLAVLQVIPSLMCPPSAVPSTTIATLCLFVACFSLTYPSRASTKLLRVLLAFPAAYFSYDVGFGKHGYDGRVYASVGLALAFMGMYGFMRTFDICIASLWDDNPPRWVKSGKLVALPTTLQGRALYSIDLLISVRGASWLRDTAWDWSPRYILTAPRPKVNRLQWLAKNIASFILQHIALDLLDTIHHTHEWVPHDPHPVTSLSILEQLVYSLCVCSENVLSITIPAHLYSTLFVCLGSDIGSWLPMLDQPFQSTSLQDFWTHRWHHILRRSFDRMAAVALFFVPTKAISPFARNVLRATIIFGFSATLHIFLLHRAYHPLQPVIMSLGNRGLSTLPHVRPLLDSSTLKFYLSQPLALLFERAVVFPITAQFRGPLRSTIRRAYAWAFLLYSGRWWSEAWVRAGLWEEPLVGFSVVRGLLKGQWWLV